MDWHNLSVWDCVFIASIALNVVLVFIIAVRAVFYTKFSLRSFGIEQIQRMGVVLPNEWREAVWERGYLTRWQWFKAKRAFSRLDTRQK